VRILQSDLGKRVRLLCVPVGSAQCETDEVPSLVHPTDVSLVLNKNRLLIGVLSDKY
jgi:hypothetical protein